MANGHSPLDRGFDWYVGLPYSDDMGCGAAPTLTMAPLNAEHTMACPACRKNNEPAVKCPADPSCGRPNGCFGEDMGVPLFHNRTIVAQPVDLGKVSQNYTVRPPNLAQTLRKTSVQKMLVVNRARFASSSPTPRQHRSRSSSTTPPRTCTSLRTTRRSGTQGFPTRRRHTASEAARSLRRRSWRW